MTLALLLTAVGGAWAQDADYNIYVNFEPDYHPMETHFNCMSMNMMEPGEIKGTLELSVDGVSKGSFNVDGEMVNGSIAAIDAGDHTYEAVFHPEGGGSFHANGGFTIDKAVTYIIYYGSTSINLGVGESTELVVSLFPDGQDGLSYSSSDASVASITKMENSDYYIIQANAAGTATITFSYAGSTNYKAADEDKTITVTVAAPEPTVEVTTNAAEEGATFTEATFAMPAFDATAEYELVRDMTISMTTQVGDGAEGYRIRLKKGEQGGYVPAEMTPQAMASLIVVHDDIENADLTNMTDYTISIFAVDEQGQPTGDAIAFANLVPGRYVAIATAKEGSAYDGETQQSNIFQLFEGYEVEIAAGEYVTFYKEENLYVEDTDAEIYTITSVGTETATAAPLSVAKAYTPILVKNKGAEKKVILLIPTETEGDEVDYAPEFIGTLEATTIAASSENQNNYAFNGKAFVFVKNAIEVGPNKCWISIPSDISNVKALRIVFGGDATGVNEVNEVIGINDNWYDLNGRKLNGMTTTKGVYILNGRKVVVK